MFDSLKKLIENYGVKKAAVVALLLFLLAALTACSFQVQRSTDNCRQSIDNPFHIVIDSLSYGN